MTFVRGRRGVGSAQRSHLATRLGVFPTKSSAGPQPNFLPSTQQSSLTTFGSRQATALKPCTVIDAVSIVSALMINGGSASGGVKAKHGKLKPWITTRGDTMSIKREDLDAGRVDFADVTSGGGDLRQFIQAKFFGLISWSR